MSHDFDRMATDIVNASKAFLQRGVGSLSSRLDKITQRLSALEKRLDAMQRKYETTNPEDGCS